MNQKNVFTVVAAVTILYSLAYYFMGHTLSAENNPTLDKAGQDAVGNILQVCGVLGIGIGLIYYAARNTPSVIWSFVVGSGLLLLNSLKHKFVDHLNVPITAIIFQGAIFLVVLYVWMQNNRSTAVN